MAFLFTSKPPYRRLKCNEKSVQTFSRKFTFRVLSARARILPVLKISLTQFHLGKRSSYIYCDVYATNKTGSSSDDWIYYQMVTHSLLITLIHRQYSLSLVYTLYRPPLHTHWDSLVPLVVSQQRISTQHCKSYTPNIPRNSSIYGTVFTSRADNSLRANVYYLILHCSTSTLLAG
jgi:hypothetical protein